MQKRTPPDKRAPIEGHPADSIQSTQKICKSQVQAFEITGKKCIFSLSIHSKVTKNKLKKKQVQQQHQCKLSMEKNELRKFHINHKSWEKQIKRLRFKFQTL